MLGRRTTTIGVAAAAALLPLALAASPAQSAENATVSVLHAVPGLTVDVYANGEELIPDFEPGTLTDPLKLPAGTYDLTVFPAGEGPDGDPAIEANDVEVPAGANATVVAHLDANGDPMLSLFANDTSSVPAGQARLTVRHVAAAPAVDVRAGSSRSSRGWRTRTRTRPRSRPAPCPPTSCWPARVMLRSARPTSTWPRARTRSSTRGAARRTTTWRSPPRPLTGCTPHRRASRRALPASRATADGMPMWLLIATAVGLAGAAGATARLVQVRARS